MFSEDKRQEMSQQILRLYHRELDRQGLDEKEKKDVEGIISDHSRRGMRQSGFCYGAIRDTRLKYAQQKVLLFIEIALHLNKDRGGTVQDIDWLLEVAFENNAGEFNKVSDVINREIRRISHDQSYDDAPVKEIEATTRMKLRRECDIAKDELKHSSVSSKGQSKMSYSAKVYRVLIASPSDVQEERKMIPEALYSFNALHSEEMGTVLLPVKWETHCRPETGKYTAQNIINEQIVNDAAILIGVFWTRIGTETDSFESGTVEEIERFIESGKPVMLYFSSNKIDPNKIDHTQHAKVLRLKERKDIGLYAEYSSLDEFSERLNKDLIRLVRKLQPLKEDKNDDYEKSVLNTLKNTVHRVMHEWNIHKDEIGYDRKELLRLLQGDLQKIVSELPEDVSNKIRTQLQNIEGAIDFPITLDQGKSNEAFKNKMDAIFKALSEIVENL